MRWLAVLLFGCGGAVPDVSDFASVSDAARALDLAQAQATDAAQTSGTDLAHAPPRDLAGVATGTIVDFDGNTYTSVTIGSAVWMVGNLRTTHLADGTAIALVADASAWSSTTAAGYAWPSGDASNAAAYGPLYNGYAVQNAKLAPTGWHVASADEWQALATALGGTAVAGGKLKEPGFAHWQSPNTGADNSSGFTAVAGGYRDDKGAYMDNYAAGGWWTTTKATATSLQFFFMDHINAAENTGTDTFAYGFSVRCVKD